MHKLFVVTAGTVAAGVGKEILRQVNEHPDSQLVVKVRYLDTARLDNRIPVRDGEWQQMHIDPVLMKALYNERVSNPRLDHMLYDGLLPKTTGVGGGQIRYNGSGALLVNREKLLQWLSTNIAELARSGDSSINIAIALIISSVGATGSGSAQHLLELIGDAAFNAKIPTPIHCDTFVLQPGTDNVRDLGLANTLALYAELAGARLELDDTDVKRYQGRIILVDWGTNSVLANLDQLQSTAGTLVRLINDPVSDFVAEYQEREADNHVLQELDALSHLPTHLSSATAVTISLGSLQEQIIQRDAAKLVNNLVSGGDTSSEEVKNRFISSVAAALTGRNDKERYRNLVKYLGGNVGQILKIKQPDTPEGVVSSQASMQGPDLNQYWQEDIRRIDASVRDMQSRGNQLVNDVKAKLLEQQRAAIRTSNLSLEGIRAAYQYFNTVVNETLGLARQKVGQPANQIPVHQDIKALNDAARRRTRPQERASAVHSTIETISHYLDDYIAEKANPVALEVLEELEYESAEQLRNLDATLSRLQKQRQTGASWAAAVSSPLSLGLNHPLAIPALSDKNKKSGDESAVDSYYNRVSIFTARNRRGGLSAAANVMSESQQLADFRGKITDQQLIDLFKGDLDLILQVAHGYVGQRVHEEVIKYSVLDVLIQDGEETLQERLKEASSRAAPLVNFIQGFAESRQEIWHVSAYYEGDEQRRILERAMQEAFGQGRYSLIATKDPTEIVIFYYVDGLPITAVQDFQGRCLDAFLQRRLDWVTQTATNVSNPRQRVGVPVYSGKDAEERVIRTRVIAQLCKATGRDFTKYKSLPELQ
jgi:hypothetical protein